MRIKSDPTIFSFSVWRRCARQENLPTQVDLCFFPRRLRPAQATPAAVAEGTLLPSLIDRVCSQTIYPRAVAADKSYGHAANFRYLWEQHITAHLARVRSPRQKPGVFGKEQFTYVPDEDVYVCPAGGG